MTSLESNDYNTDNNTITLLEHPDGSVVGKIIEINGESDTGTASAKGILTAYNQGKYTIDWLENVDSVVNIVNGICPLITENNACFTPDRIHPGGQTAIDIIDAKVENSDWYFLESDQCHLGCGTTGTLFGSSITTPRKNSACSGSGADQCHKCTAPPNMPMSEHYPNSVLTDYIPSPEEVSYETVVADTTHISTCSFTPGDPNISWSAGLHDYIYNYDIPLVLDTIEVFEFCNPKSMPLVGCSLYCKSFTGAALSTESFIIVKFILCNCSVGCIL